MTTENQHDQRPVGFRGSRRRPVVIAAIAALGYQSRASLSSTAASPVDVRRSEHRGARRSAAQHGVAGTRPSRVRPNRTLAGPCRPEPAPGCNRQRREGDDGLSRARTTRYGSARTARRSRSPTPMSPTPTAGADSRSRSCPSPPGAIDRTRRPCRHRCCRRRTTLPRFWRDGTPLGGPVCCPDERHRTVAGDDPHPLHRPQRLRRRTPCRLPPTRCALSIGDGSAGVREHRPHRARRCRSPARGNTNTLLGHNGLSAWRLARTTRPAAGSPSGPSAGSTASGRRSPGSCWASPAPTGSRRSRGRRRHGRPHRRSTGCAGSTATKLLTRNCTPKPSITPARPYTRPRHPPGMQR